MKHVHDHEIKAYEPLLEKIARPLVGRGNAEMDDLVQEGRIFVWLRLSHGLVPAADFIRFRMLNYIRFLSKQQRGEGASYFEMIMAPDYEQIAV